MWGTPYPPSAWTARSRSPSTAGWGPAVWACNMVACCEHQQKTRFSREALTQHPPACQHCLLDWSPRSAAQQLAAASRAAAARPSTDQPTSASFGCFSTALCEAGTRCQAAPVHSLAAAALRWWPHRPPPAACTPAPPAAPCTAGVSMMRCTPRAGMLPRCLHHARGST
jgi:hypothetical protein